MKTCTYNLKNNTQDMIHGFKKYCAGNFNKTGFMKQNNVHTLLKNLIQIERIHQSGLIK